MTAFSKRHRRALAEDALAPRLGATASGRIRRLFEQCNRTYTDVLDNGWNYDTDTLADLAEELRDLYGADRLPGSDPKFSIGGFIADAPVECVFDALELFAANEAAGGFAIGLNKILAEEEVSWRMLDGQMFLLDDTFARSELAGRADQSLRQAGFSGASAELRRARHRLSDDDGRSAVHSAGSAFESVAMALLDTDRGGAKKLLQKLSAEGYFNAVPPELRERFIREVLMTLPWMRNELGGHGQGQGTVEVPLPYAQLATDLAASFCHFLIALKFQRDGEPETVDAESPASEAVTGALRLAVDTSDFEGAAAAAGSPEDDIPF
jgi:hypothetical protein